MPSTLEVKAWYDDLYTAKGLASMRPRAAYPLLLDALAPRPGARLLDVSCGSGFLLAAAASSGLDTVGVDLSHEAGRLSHRVSPSSGVAIAAGEALPFRDAAFDHVTCLGSLEHFLDPDQGLREIRRVTKPAARCLITVPNRWFVGWPLMGRVGTPQQDVQELLLSRGEWRRRFTRQGFSTLAVTPDLWHADKWRYRAVPSRVKRIAYAAVGLVWRLIPLRLQYQFVFLLQRD
jgi:SAM-dependent methyltransferase